MKPTIHSLMKQSSQFLKVYGFERPRHESVIIFKDILKKSYVDILSNSDLKISITKTNKILENLFKRLKGKPLSKISGVKEFYSREFITSEDTLDPRPDTELIVDVVKNLSKDSTKKKLNILDGTIQGTYRTRNTYRKFLKFASSRLTSSTGCQRAKLGRRTTCTSAQAI